MDPIHPIVPSSPRIPPVGGTPRLPALRRDERRRREDGGGDPGAGPQRRPAEVPPRPGVDDEGSADGGHIDIRV
jgi:hypothetical protein